MQGHLKALAVDLLFAWPVKVELLEFVPLAADCHEAPGSVIDHDRVAVIDDVQWDRLVIELDGRQVGLLRIADVDGRLMMPVHAGSKLGTKLTPMTRPMRWAVVPGVRGGLLLLRCGR